MTANKVHLVAKNIMFLAQSTAKTMSATTSMLFWVTSFRKYILYFTDEMSNGPPTVEHISD